MVAEHGILPIHTHNECIAEGKRRTVQIPEERYLKMRKAAYWEGYKSMPEFIWHVVDRFMEERKGVRRDGDYADVPTGQTIEDK